MRNILKLGIKKNRKYILGIDLGGTHLRTGVVSWEGQLFLGQCLPMLSSYRKTIGLLRNLLRNYTTQFSISGIGIGIAGQVCPEGKRLIFAPNLGWKNKSIADELQAATTLPVRLENDVHAIAMGEWLCGGGRGISDLLCLILGTGVGAGVIQNNCLITGYGHSYGEVGHMCLDVQGMTCRCGARGCIETFLGGWGLVKRAGEAGLIVKNAQELFALYRLSDPKALFVVKQFKEALVATSVSLVNGFNPGRLLLGGGILQGIPEAIFWVQEQVPLRALPTATKRLTILPTTLGAFSGVIGAAMLFWKNID